MLLVWHGLYDGGATKCMIPEGRITRGPESESDGNMTWRIS